MGKRCFHFNFNKYSDLPSLKLMVLFRFKKIEVEIRICLRAHTPLIVELYSISLARIIVERRKERGKFCSDWREQRERNPLCSMIHKISSLVQIILTDRLEMNSRLQKKVRLTNRGIRIFLDSIITYSCPPGPERIRIDQR